MITNVIKYYGEPLVFAKYNIFSKILFYMLSNPMMNCGTNFLKTLYFQTQSFDQPFDWQSSLLSLGQMSKLTVKKCGFKVMTCLMTYMSVMDT